MLSWSLPNLDLGPGPTTGEKVGTLVEDFLEKIDVTPRQPQDAAPLPDALPPPAPKRKSTTTVLLVVGGIGLAAAAAYFVFR